MVYHGYLVLLSTFLMRFVGLGVEYSAGLYLLPLQEAFPSSTRALVSLVPSIYCSCGLLASLFSGTLQSKLSYYYESKGYNPLHSVRPMFALGGFFLGLGPILCIYSPKFIYVLLSAMLTGVGIGLTGYTAAGICVQWFNKNRGQFLLLATSGSGVGNFMFTHLSEHLIAASGWKNAMFVTSILSFAIALIGSLCMRLPNSQEVEIHEHVREQKIKKEEVPLTPQRQLESLIHSTSHSPLILHINDSSEDYESIHSEILTSSLEDEVAKDQDDQMDYLPETLQQTEVASTPPRTKSITALPQQRRAYTPINNSVIAINQTLIKRSHIVPGMKDSLFMSFIGSVAEYESIRELPIHQIPSFKSSTVTSSFLDSVLLPSSFKTVDGAIESVSLLQALNTRTSIFLLLSGFSLSFSFTTFYEQLPAFIVGEGFSSQDGSNILALTGIAMITGSMTLGFVIEKFGPIRMLKLLLVLLSTLMFLWPHCTNLSILRVVAFLYGFCTTVTFNLPLIILADVFGDAAPSTILYLTGISNAISTPGYLFGPSISGYLFDMSGSYVSASIFTGITTLFSVIALIFIPDPAEEKRRLGIA